MFKASFASLALVTLLSMTQQAQAKFSMQFTYGGEWVNVGDANIDYFAYSLAYNHFDQYGGQFDQAAQAWTHHVRLSGSYMPYSYPGPDIGFTLTAQAAYGTDGRKINGWGFRDLFIHTMSDGLKKLMDPTGWSICVPHTNCQAVYQTNCPDKCTDLHWGHMMPSYVRISVYDDQGRLRPEFYEIRISNWSKSGGNQCSTGMKALEMAVGLIPTFGSLMSTIIKVTCLF